MSSYRHSCAGRFKGVALKEMDKIQKYQDLAGELHKIWQVKMKVVPVVVRALGNIPKALGKHLDERDKCENRSVEEGGAVRNSEDPKKDPRDLRLRDVA